MNMKAHVVRQGEYLTKLAHTHGFSADAVWNDPKNASLRQRRPDREMLAPGDVLYLPETPKKGLPITAGVTNRYVAIVPKVSVTMVMKDGDQPVANEPYILEGLGEPLPGKTGTDGALSFMASVHVREVRVVFYEKDIVYPLRIGDLDPIHERSGVRQRLEHLGHYGWRLTPAPDEEAAPVADEGRDRRAIEAFQIAQGIEPTGEVDEATRTALVDAHGS